MKLNQMKAFKELMATGSVSQAARNLHRTQPAISALISSLEDELGMPLFERRKGRLYPVPEAKYLLEETNSILDKLAQTERTMKNMRDLEQGTIRIVTMPGPGVFFLPDLVTRFIDERKNIKIELISRSSVQVDQLVSAQQFDVGLADYGISEETETQLASYEIFQLECFCCVHKQNDLANKPSINATDLNNKPMASLYSGHPTDLSVRAAFEKKRVKFNNCFEMMYFIPMFTFVENQLAYSIVDPISAESYRIYRGKHQQIVFRPFKPKVYHKIAIITPLHRPLSHLAKVFTDHLRSEISRIQKQNLEA